MIVTTKQIVKKLPTNLRLMSVLEEAIANSIQANATEISIYFETIDTLLQEYRKVKNVFIVDNGDGFTDENINSFNHYLSDYKQVLGCKGIGRFTYLTICDKVSFESFNGANNIKFDFTINTEEIKPKIVDGHFDKLTKVAFFGVKDKEVSIDLSDEAKEVAGHFLSIFKFMCDEDKNLLIKFYIDGKFAAEINAQEHGAGFIDELFTIEVNDSITEEFILSYKQKGVTIKGFYCADKRSVKRDDLNINIRTPIDKGLLFFLSSTLFDRTVNDERNDFAIKDSDKNLMQLDWDIINRKLYSRIDTIAKKFNIDIDEISNKNKKESLNSAPYLAAYISKSQNMATSSEIIKEAKELFNKDKEYIRNFRNKKNSDYEDRLYTSNQAELAEYIFDKEKIILDIKKDMDDVNSKTNETIIHNKIMKKRTSNEDYFSYKDNNLWLFDERFMIYSYAYSDKTVNDILGLSDSDKNTRPDICIFTKSQNDVKEIILIELKGSDATGEKNAGGLNELNKYTRKIKNHFESNGEEVRIWSYLITALNKEARQEIEDFPGIKQAYTTKGKMYYVHNENLRIY